MRSWFWFFKHVCSQQASRTDNWWVICSVLLFCLSVFVCLFVCLFTFLHSHANSLVSHSLIVATAE